MRFLARIFKAPERTDARHAVYNALRTACEKRGFATSKDCAALPFPHRTITWNIARWVEAGRFHREGRSHLYLNPDSDEPLDNSATADASPAPIIRKSTAELLAEIEGSRPPEEEPPDPRQQPVPEEHRRICPAVKLPEPPPEHLHDEVLAWHDLQQHVPASVVDLARREWEGALQRGISPALTHANLLKRIPLYLRERGFDELCRRYPRGSRAEFDRLVDELLAEAKSKPEFAGKSLPELTGVAVNHVLEVVSHHADQSLTPLTPPPAAPSTTIAPTPHSKSLDAYAAQIAGRKREVADETKFLRHEEADLHLLQSGKNRTRTYISINQAGASTFERAVDASCRGQHDEHNRKASGATSDTPGLVARMKSLFD